MNERLTNHSLVRRSRTGSGRNNEDPGGRMPRQEAHRGGLGMERGGCRGAAWLETVAVVTNVEEEEGEMGVLLPGMSQALYDAHFLKKSVMIVSDSKKKPKKNHDQVRLRAKLSSFGRRLVGLRREGRTRQDPLAKKPEGHGGNALMQPSTNHSRAASDASKAHREDGFQTTFL